MGKKGRKAGKKSGSGSTAKGVVNRQQTRDDSAKSPATYRHELKQMGLEINKMEGDGNCLFRSCSDQLFNDEAQHGRLRQETVDYIKKNQVDFEPFIEDDEPFEKYCIRMAQDGTWGGNQEIYAISRLFSVNIVIHHWESPRMEIQTENKDDTMKPQTIHLSYQGQEHYDSLVRVLSSNDGRNSSSGDVLKEEEKPKEPITDLKGPSAPKRNRPCPCGSKIKYKDCCRKRKASNSSQKPTSSNNVTDVEVSVEALLI